MWLFFQNTGYLKTSRFGGVDMQCIQFSNSEIDKSQQSI